jgi:hypothetical protein
MAGKKTPKQTAIDNLLALSGVRVNANDGIGEIFPFGLFATEHTDPIGDDRTIAIITATVLEQSLEAGIMTKLRTLDASDERAVFFGDSAPLNSLCQKITMAYALGIIGPQARSDLNIIRNVRNTFAHSRLTITFSEPAVVEACGFLTLPDRWPGLVADQRDARDTFVQSAFQYMLGLITLGQKGGDEDFEGMAKVDAWSCLDD